MRKIDSNYINANNLIIRKIALSYLFEVIFYLIVIGFWYIMFLTHQDGFKEYSNFQKYCIIGLPLILIPNIIRGIKVYINGEIYYFDATSKEIRKNQKKIAVFSDIDFIQIRTLHGEQENEYRLSIILKSGREIRIEKCDDYENLLDVAEDIARILQVVIINK